VRAVWLCGRQCDSHFPDLGKVDRGDGASLCAVTVKLFRKVGIPVEGVVLDELPIIRENGRFIGIEGL
jgi:hypothetical protein